MRRSHILLLGAFFGVSGIGCDKGAPNSSGTAPLPLVMTQGRQKDIAYVADGSEVIEVELDHSGNVLAAAWLEGRLYGRMSPGFESTDVGGVYEIDLTTGETNEIAHSELIGTSGFYRSMTAGASRLFVLSEKGIVAIAPASGLVEIVTPQALSTLPGIVYTDYGLAVIDASDELVLIDPQTGLVTPTGVSGLGQYSALTGTRQVVAWSSEQDKPKLWCGENVEQVLRWKLEGVFEQRSPGFIGVVETGTVTWLVRDYEYPALTIEFINLHSGHTTETRSLGPLRWICSSLPEEAYGDPGGT